MERRLFSGSALRAEQHASGAKVVSGYAAKYSKVTHIAGQFREVLLPGAFARALARKDETKFLINHGGMPFARTGNGTLKLSEDKTGLFFKAMLPARVSAASDLFELIRLQTMSEMSFSFQVSRGDDIWDDDPDDCPDDDCNLPLRKISTLRLYDVSCVNTGAYPDTQISAVPHVVEDLSAHSDEDDDLESTDPWYQASGVLVSAEARAMARRFRRHTAAKEATDFAANLFRAQIRATKTLLGGQ